MANSKRLAAGVVLIAAGLVVIGLAHWLAPAWFAAKTVGIGFRPATWQGWAAVVVGVISVMAGSRMVRGR